MSSTLAPFGFRPAYHQGGGVIRPKRYKCVDATQAAYGTAFYQNAPVKNAGDGSFAVAAAGGDWLGVFQGVEYTDTTGKPVVSNWLAASPTGITNVYFWIIDDPQVVFEVQSETAIANTAIGDEPTTFSATYTTSTGSTATGLSTCALTGTLAGSGSQGMVRVIDIGLGADNAWGDSYTVVQVMNARHQNVAVKVAY